MPTIKTNKIPRKPRFKHIVCKPCWELKYCPYGHLVEYFPLIHDEDDFPISEIKASYNHWITAILTGELENEEDVFNAIEKILCLEPTRWQWINRYRTEELRCIAFGHICPVFFTAEPFTETKEGRNTTRKIPRAVMLKVIRRDGQVCAICRKNVFDDEVEFDHIIPFARGGATTPENLRVLCRECNRKKKDSLHEILEDDTTRIKYQ
jgi:hypothetical protein